MTSLLADLQGRRAVVTGGNRGIGRGIALALADHGADVHVLGHSGAAEAESVAAEISERGVSGSWGAGDMTDPNVGPDLISQAEAALGGIDVLVNAAGGFPPARPLVEISFDEWNSVIGANLTSMFLSCKTAVPGMIDRGWGRIVNIASEFGRHVPSANAASHYVASKHGVLGLTRQLAREVAPYGITVNATAPGTTYTDRTIPRLTPDVESAIVAEIPVGRIADVDDQTGIVCFLASNAARHITGATFDVNGGRVMI